MITIYLKELIFILKYVTITAERGELMAGAKAIKQILIERNMTIKQLADALGLAHQSMRNKLYRDHFSYEEIVKIADLLNCDVKIITRDSGKEFM
jgi:DNA-binding Xre family transcriptional regulator